ncbi:hypothetical protein [Chromohalobacter sarecensis]|uniref:hypothetical protein n=1 Tax=Chromohalobacter sarecensis TaxID=245294 RepID=UPI001FF36C73|nr:hypothetical protein [Chromohalobacter sarecensis]MCK0713473.1 hypothetical protein [Chromohalobacter sarecensis]
MVILYRHFLRAFQQSTSADQTLSLIFRGLVRTGNESLKALPDAWWPEFFRYVTSTNPDGGESSEQVLLEIAETLNSELLEADRWLDLYRICLFSGLFRLGLQVRYKAEGAIKREASSKLGGIRSQCLALAVSLESGETEEATAALERLARLKLSEYKLAQGFWLRDLLCSRTKTTLVEAYPGQSPLEHHAELSMLDAAKGCSIAMVGPVASSVEAGPEIDGFNLVAKFNYRGGEQGCDPLTQGRRIDISYYNIDQAKYIAQHSDAGFPANLRFPVFIKAKGFRAVKKVTSEGRIVRNAQWLLLDSEFHAGTNALVDLFRFEPKKVKVFNSDLMLTAGRYQGYWRPGTKPVNYCFSFSKTHDPFMQFNYLKRLWASGLIEGDARFGAIMENGLEAYVKDLQRAHGESGRQVLAGNEGLPGAL